MNMIIISIVVLAAILGTREVLIGRKRPARITELRHHVEMILDSNGCSQAIDHAYEAEHLVEHYLIRLDEVGFNGNIAELFEEARDSTIRYHLKGKAILTSATQA